MTALAAWLRDDFEDGVISPAWTTAFTTTGSATRAETGGQLRLTLPSSTAGSHQAGVQSAAAYDLTGGQFSINVGTMVSTSVVATAALTLYDSADATNWVRIAQLSGNLNFQKSVAGVVTTTGTAVTWNASTHKYWRIRESAGTIYFDTSSNSTSWTNRGSVTVALSMPITAVLVRVDAVCGNVASPGSFRIDEFNLIYPALTTNWHWTQADWSLLYRFKSITLAATSGQGYIAIASEAQTGAPGTLVSPRYFAGPLGSSSGGYLALTEYSTQAAAQAMAVDLPLDGRWDLPDLVECRFIRLYHRSTTGSSYRLDEYYPRRLVQSDDIEAESIRAINIAANAITADKIFVLELSAITADMGELTAGTITGGTIQTAASGARILMSAAANGGLVGYSGSDTYDPAAGTGTYQALWKKTDGKLYAGAGAVVLGSDGVRIVDAGTFSNTTAYKFTDSAGSTVYGGLYGHNNLGAPRISLQTDDIASATILINALAASGNSGFATLQAAATGGSTVKVEVKAGAAGDQVTISGPSTAGTVVDMFAMVTARGGLNVGTATGAGTGEIKATSSIAGSAGLTVTNSSSNSGAYGMVNVLSNTGNSAVLLHNSSTNTGYAGAGSFNILTIGSEALGIGTSNAVRIQISAAGAIGFFGSTGGTRPTVSGSRATDTWRQSLMAALAGLGLITDSSTA